MYNIKVKKAPETWAWEKPFEMLQNTTEKHNLCSFLCTGLKKTKPQKLSVQIINKQNKFLLELHSIYFPLS